MEDKFGAQFAEVLDKIAHKPFTIEYMDGTMEEYLSSPDKVEGTGLGIIVKQYILYKKQGVGNYTEVYKAETRNGLMDYFNNGKMVI